LEGEPPSSIRADRSAAKAPEALRRDFTPPSSVGISVRSRTKRTSRRSGGKLYLAAMLDLHAYERAQAKRAPPPSRPTPRRPDRELTAVRRSPPSTRQHTTP
jgi:hypothetical protein